MPTLAAAPLSVIALAVCAAFALTGCAVSFDLADTTERTEHDTIDADGITRLEIATANGRIAVDPGDVDTIDLSVVLRESREGDAEYRVVRTDDTLRVEGECDGRWFDGCSVGFDVTVPADLDLAIDVTTDNGRIDFGSLSGTIDAETDNGAITGEDLAATAVRARTDNGRIELLFAETPRDVVATSDNGAIAVRFPDDGGAHDVETHSDNGAVDVDVRTDPTSTRQIVAESDNGAIDVEYRR